MGFRNPFRIQVDENDVAYVTDYSPDAQHAAAQPRPVRRRPHARSCASRPTTAIRSATRASSATTSGTSASSLPGTTTVGTPADNPPQPIDCGNPAVCSTTRAGCVTAARASSPACALTPPVTDPEIWYSYRDNNATAPLGTPCFGYYATTPGPIAPGSTTECPRLFPELYTGGVAPHGAAKYHYDPANPNTKKFPAVLRQLDLPGRVRPGHAARDQARLAEPRVQDQQPARLRRRRTSRTRRSTFECDNPEDMQFGADGSLYLLTYGDGFFNINPDAGMYRWDYVKGQRAPKAVLTTDKTDGAVAADGQVHGLGSSDADPGDSIRYEWDFGDGSPLSDRGQPDAHLHAGRPLHGRPDGHRLVRASRPRRARSSPRATPARR